ncbi:MAG: hypothetical protein WCG31_06485, partial [Deltaproteobacteria bacterium]
MKNRLSSLLLFISLLVSATTITGVSAAKDPYNPGQTYSGKYTTAALYYRSPRNPNWYRGLSGTYPDGVRCRDALNHFMNDGKWQGHLNTDGSCASPAEPSEWAVGNRL